MTDSASSSVPDSPVDTPPSSIDIPNTILRIPSEEDKFKAARLKGEANKAFQSTMQQYKYYHLVFIHVAYI